MTIYKCSASTVYRVPLIVDCYFEAMFSVLFLYQQRHSDKQTQQTSN